jgi:hypothetical protein
MAVSCARYHVFADAGFANLDAELEQFAVDPGSALRVEEARGAVDFPWLCPPLPASCPFRSILAPREAPPLRIPPCRFPVAVLQARLPAPAQAWVIRGRNNRFRCEIRGAVW